MSSKGRTRKAKLLRYGKATTGYGDVHHPSLECAENRRGAYPLEDYVSKTVDRSSALQEMRKLSALKQMGYDFISVPDHMCEGEGKMRVGEGKERKATSQQRYLMIAPYAGKTLREYTREMLVQAERLADYIYALKELRENVKKMNQDNFFHNDLTDLNMTYREDLRKAFLIDFEYVDRERASPKARSNSNSPSSVLNRDPNDESYFVDQSIEYLMSGLKETLSGVITMDDAKHYRLLPRSSKRSSSRTKKISRPRSI
jgi:hypothetical protein